MSTLKTNTLTGVTTEGSINITNGSVTTDIQKALVKVYSRTGATQSSIQASFGQTGFTDEGTGHFSVSFTNNMSSSIYVTISAAVSSVDNNSVTSTLATTGYAMRNFNQAGSAFDRAQASCAMGDLA
mgnify:CR=1 FL=1